MINGIRHYRPILFIIISVGIFFWQFFLLAKLPIPTDTIVGMYHPWRDVVWNGFVSGVPFKNFLITDPVRQQYPWRELAVTQLKKGELPIWNPYSFAGTPLLANFQSAPFYPLNILFFLLPFSIAWSILVMFQPLLGGIFLYMYLRFFNTQKIASLLGATVFVFSGFSIAWMEWNTIGHTIVWLPLLLLSIDKIAYYSQAPLNSKFKKLFIWMFILVFGLSSSLFAGHIQTYFYMLLVFLAYSGMRMYSVKNKLLLFILLASCLFVHITLSAIQWFPSLQFILLSARTLPQNLGTRPDWFIPWQHLVQFIAPDFFGNPTTLNYWGIWNYGEFVGYIGILPFILVIYACMIRRDKKTLWFSTIIILALVFALPTPLARLPFIFNIPLVSTSQPSRLLGIVDFFFACLAALGMDSLLMSLNEKKKNSKFFLSSLIVCLCIAGLLIVVLYQTRQEGNIEQNWLVAYRNSIFPFILSVVSVCIAGIFYLRNNSKITIQLLVLLILGISGIDLFRFGWKFISFSEKNWLYPQTGVSEFLKNQPGQFRFMSTDSRLFPPNFSIAYKLQTVEGYDPLYLHDYGEYVSAWVRGSYEETPVNFNRIITPQNYTSVFTDLTNVRFILSLKDEVDPKLQLVFRQGETRVYENTRVYPRSFIVSKVKKVSSKKENIQFLLDSQNDLRNVATVVEDIPLEPSPVSTQEFVTIISYTENEVILDTHTVKKRFIVLTDSFYPDWKAYIDQIPTKIYKTDFIFRGVVVPEGNHTLRFNINKVFNVL